MKHKKKVTQAVRKATGAGRPIGGAMKKTITKGVLAANRENGRKSPGPRTPAGKSNARRNAITHGFFAQELVMNDEERRQFEVLRRTLHPQLLPKTVLQDVGFSEILSCIGRCRLAFRQEIAPGQ
jgi:hypothetical protein